MPSPHPHRRRAVPLALTLAILAGLWTAIDDEYGSAKERPISGFSRPLPATDKNAAPEPSSARLPASAATTHPDFEALASGAPITVTGEDGSVFILTLQPADLFADDFAIRRGSHGGEFSTFQAVRGFAFPRSQEGETTTPQRAVLALVGHHLYGTWDNGDGTVSQLSGHFGDRTFTLQRERRALTESALVSEGPLATCRQLAISPRDVISSTTASLTLPLRPPAPLPAAARGGLEPATGEPTRYVDPIPMTENYALSLVDMSLLLVLDSSATRPNEHPSLESLASRWLATVANVATIYENQLGIRLRLQELILIPDDPDFQDVPSQQALPDFTSWLSQHRSRSVYRWDSAFKVGQGLAPSELGIAYVASLGRSDSIGIIGRETGWTTLAHEMGHSLGANHTRGGLMNAQANDGGDRDFFTQVNGASPGVTAAEEIYKHSAEILEGTEPLRHPREFPFAQNDFRVGATGNALRFSPLQNDLPNAPHGTANPVLNLEELSRVVPAGAGEWERDGPLLIFHPSPGFTGPAWFSYSLRGSLGNDGRGWLHKGDIAIQIGEASPELDLSFVPGEVRTVAVGDNAGAITPARNAQVHDLPDQPGHVLVRVDPDATGNDSFQVGPRRFTLTYADAIEVQTVPDVYWHHSGLGPLAMEPLANDRPSSEGGLSGKSRISLGSDLLEDPSIAFPHAFGLLEATNFSPDKGTLDVVSHPASGDGTPTGRLIFTPHQDAKGIVSIHYSVRDARGSTASETITIHLLGETITLVEPNAQVHYHIPQTPQDAPFWTLRAFDDRAWPLGALPVGYEDGRDYEDWIRTDVGRQMTGVNSSIYLRIPFAVSDPSAISRLLLRMRVDDGYVAHLNGLKVWEENAPPNAAWNAEAVEGREAEEWVTTDLSEMRSLLAKGENLLAIQGMNSQIDSSDFLVMPELVALSYPLLGEIVSPSSASVSVPRQTGIRFEALPASEDVTLVWEVTEAPIGSRPTARPEGRFFDLFISTSGTYRIHLLARRADGATTVEERVIRVGLSRPHDLLGSTLQAIPDLAIPSLNTNLSALHLPAIPGQPAEIVWEGLSGPGTAAFSDPGALSTDVTFSRAGRYQVRVTALRSELTLFDDIWVDVLTGIKTLVGEQTQSTYHYLNSSSYDPRWKHLDFSDAHWFRGTQGLGYDLTNGYAPYIGTDLRDTMYLRNPSVYVRYPFLVENISAIDSLELRLRVDDGCVVYLNGQEIYRRHAPLYGLDPTSTALRAADEGLLVEPTPIDLAEFIFALRPGYNTLAIQGLNQSSQSSDFLIEPTLLARMGQTPPTETDLLAQALGKNQVRVETITEPPTLEVTFPLRSAFTEEGGRFDLESSANLQDWERWPYQSLEREPLDETWESLTLSGPRDDRFRFLRLRVTQ